MFSLMASPRPSPSPPLPHPAIQPSPKASPGSPRPPIFIYIYIYTSKLYTYICLDLKRFSRNSANPQLQETSFNKIHFGMLLYCLPLCSYLYRIVIVSGKLFKTRFLYIWDIYRWTCIYIWTYTYIFVYMYIKINM